MKLLTSLFMIVFPSVATAHFFGSSATGKSPSAVFQGDQTTSDRFVYADFEKVENGRPVSNGGGMVQLYGGQESTPVHFKGLANASPAAPEIVVLKGDEKNHAATFEYNLTGPNQWANVTLEVQGHANKEGKTVADDVSGYKNLSVQLYVTGTEGVRVEFISHGQGINLPFGFPQIPLKLKPGFNTYLIPLKYLAQPSWVEQKVDPKEVLKKLTAISISVYCNGCALQQGVVVVDNLIFQK